jgi:hypothetical protein
LVSKTAILAVGAGKQKTDPPLGSPINNVIANSDFEEIVLLTFFV